MSKYRTDLVRGQPLPQSFLSALQEFIGTLDANLVVTKATATSIQVVAGPGSAQAAVGIDGLFRYNAATVTAAMPASPPLGTYDIYAVASANSFSNAPAPDTDNTDYSFGLQIVASAATPTGTWNGQAISNYRKLGTLTWDGTQITGIQQTAGVAGAAGTAGGDLAGGYPNPSIKPSVALSGTPTAPTAAVDTNTPQIASTGFVVGQAAGVAPVMDGAATVGASTRFARADHVHPSDTSRAPLASPTFTGTVTIPTLSLTGNGTLAAATVVTWGGDTNLYRSSVNTLRTDGTFYATGSAVGGISLAQQVGIGWSGHPGGAPGIYFGPTQGAQIYSPSAGYLQTDSAFTTGGTINANAIGGGPGVLLSAVGLVSVSRPAANLTSTAILTAITTDTLYRWRVRTDGMMEWGPGGAAAVDANLYRSGVGALKSDGSLELGGSLIGRDAAAYSAGHRALTLGGVAAIGYSTSTATPRMVLWSNYDPTTNLLVDNTKPAWRMKLQDGASDQLVIERAPAGAGAPAWTVLATLSSAGMFATTGTRKLRDVAVPATPANSYATVVVNVGTPFADASYTAVASVRAAGAFAGATSPRVNRIVTKTATSVTVEVATGSAALAAGDAFVDVIVIHD